MTDYTITTDFGAKDSLPSGNAAKVIKGSEFTTEFTNIKTAVNSKADTAGDTFTGVVNFSADVAFDTNTLFVDVSANRVGIGTTSPSAPLDVRGSSIELTGSNPELVLKDTDSAESQCVIKNADGTIDIKADVNSERNNTRIRFYTDGTQHMELKGGNLGIGVTSPASKLHITGSNSGATGVADGTLIVEQGSAPSIQILSANTQTQSIKFGDPQDGDVGKINYSHADNHMALFTDGTEAMRIDASGNLLVGKTAVGIGTVGIEATGTGNMNLTASGSEVLNANRLSTDGDIFRFFKNGSTVGSISVTSSATAYNTSSDERLKENIADSADAGSKIDAIQIRQFDWKADGSHQDYGVIAQELVTVAPEAVHQPEDSEEMMGVDYSKLVPMLIKEVQSLRSRVAELENI